MRCLPGVLLVLIGLLPFGAGAVADDPEATTVTSPMPTVESADVESGTVPADAAALPVQAAQSEPSPSGDAPASAQAAAPVPVPETTTDAGAIAPGASDSPDPETTVQVPDQVEDMAAYLASVRTHVESDPSLAAAYLVFWSELKAGSKAGDRPAAENPTDTYAPLVTLGQHVAESVRRQRRPDSVEYLVTDVLEQTLATLAGRSTPTANEKAGRQSVAPEAQRLLANLETLATPRLNTEGRYEFRGALRTVAAIGSSAEVWNLCKAVPDCIKAHDTLFAPAMQGLSLIADVSKRLRGDPVLADSPLWQNMQPLARAMDTQTQQLPSLEARNAALSQSARAHWRAVLAELPVVAGITGPGTARDSGPASVADNASATSGTAQPPDRSRLDALFTLGLAGAELTGNRQLAQAFSMTRSPALEFASLASQGALAGSFATSLAGVALLVAGVQALSMLDGDDADTRAAADELKEFIGTLDARTHAAIADSRAEQRLAINVVDTRVASLGLAMDVVKTDIARLENASRRRIATAFETDTARRWSEFDAANDRCFSLRHRNLRTRRLSTTEFRRCEDRFLQGAIIKARYANRSAEFSRDARFISIADASFPFHNHYPLLLARSGADARQVLTLPDPVEWQQNAAALLRLYQEHPAQPGEQPRRSEALTSLSQAGARLQEALRGLVVAIEPTGGKTFRTALHQEVLDSYQQSLTSLAARVRRLDDPATHPFGKRMTEGMTQPLPTGAKRAAIDAELSRQAFSGGSLKVCNDAGAEAFLPQQDRVVAEARRFFGSPIAPEELAAAWNRDMVDGLQLQLDNVAGMVPTPFLWASLDGMGTLEICLSRFRPETAAFTREDGPVKDTLRGTVIVGADIEVRFYPSDTLVKQTGSSVGTPLLLARHSGGRACTFGYRNDDEGCSRAQCLKAIAPTLWGTDKRLTARHVACEEAPLRSHLGTAPPVDGKASDQWFETLDRVYWNRQSESLTRIEADALRSEEFESASAQFLQYFALSGITLGTHPEMTRQLDALFGEASALTPRAVLRALVRDRTAQDSQLTLLADRLRKVLEQIAKRGGELEDERLLMQIPHLALLNDMRDRIDLAASVYTAAR